MRRSLITTLAVTSLILATVAEGRGFRNRFSWIPSWNWGHSVTEGISIDAQAAKANYNVGEAAVITGQLRVLASSGSESNLSTSQLNKTERHFYFPDFTSEVTSSVVQTGKLDFKFTTPPLSGDLPNVFTTIVGNMKPGTQSLLKTLSKLDARVVRLNKLIAELQGRHHRDLRVIAKVTEIRNMVQTIADRIRELQLTSGALYIGKHDLPLSVQNITGGKAVYAQTMGGFLVTLSFDPGTAVQGQKTLASVKVENVRDLLPPDVRNALEEDDHDRWKIEVRWKGSVIKTLGPLGLPPNEDASYSFTTEKLTSGAKTLEARVIRDRQHGSDKLYSVTQLDLAVQADSTAPAWLAGSIPNSTHRYVQTLPTVSAVAQDPFGLMDPDSVTATMTGTTDAGAAVNSNVRAAITVEPQDQGRRLALSGDLNPLQEGEYQLKLVAADLAGNKAAPNPLTTTFRIDRTAPAMTLTGTPPALTNLGALSLVVSTSDRSPFTTTVLQNAQVIASSTALSLATTVSLLEGINTIEVRSLDSVGNTSVLGPFITVRDSLAPSLSNLAPSNGQTLFTQTFAVSGQSNEALSGASLNGQALTLSSDKRSFSGIYTASREGDLDLEWQATDLAGNTTSLTTHATIVLKVLNGDLVSVEPAQDGLHLLVVGAPGATRPGALVKASAGFFNSGSTTSGGDGAFQIQLNRFTTATVTAKDPETNREEEIQVQFVVDTSLSGIVKDATDGRPLPFVSVMLSGSNELVQTNASGVFRLEGPVPTGVQTLVFDGATVPESVSGPERRYSKTSVVVNIGLNQSNTLAREIFLTSLNLETATDFPATASGVISVTSPEAPGVELEVPADKVVFPDGTNVGKISISTIPAERTTVAVPGFARPETVYALEPSGTTFEERVPVTLPNVNEFPAGTDLVLLSMDSNSGYWDIDGLARVSADGNRIETIDLNGAHRGISHFSLLYASPLAPKAAESGKKDKPGADVFNGALASAIAAPAYRSLGQDVTPSLIYKSSWASPSTLITNIIDTPKWEFKPKPRTFDEGNWLADVDIKVSQSGWLEPDFLTIDYELANQHSEEPVKLKGLPKQSTVSYSVDLSDLESGPYFYRSHYEAHYKQVVVTTIKTKIDPIIGPSETIVKKKRRSTLLEEAFPQDLQGTLYVQNKKNSPAGRGWMISGVQTILNPESSALVLEEGDGNITPFALNNTITTLYSGQNDDFRLDGSFGFGDYPVAAASKHSGDNWDTYQIDLQTGNTGAFLGRVKDLEAQVATNGYGYRLTIQPGGAWVLRARCAWREERKKFSAQAADIVPPTQFSIGFNSARAFNTLYLMQEGSNPLNLMNNVKNAPKFTFGPFIDVAAATILSNTVIPNSVAFCNEHFGGGCTVTSSDSDAFDFADGNGGALSPPPSVANRNLLSRQFCETTTFNWNREPFGTYPDRGAVDGARTSARFNLPEDILRKPDGLLLIADTGNNVVRELNLNTDTVRTVVGNYGRGNTGDGGPATDARLDQPKGLALDAAGNLYVSTNDGFIRKVEANTQVITRFAGIADEAVVEEADRLSFSFRGPTHMIVDDANRRLYVSDEVVNRIAAIDLDTGSTQWIVGKGDIGDQGENGPAGLAHLNRPRQLALDPQGNLLINDSGNNKVKRVNFQNTTGGTLLFAANSLGFPRVTRNTDGTFLREDREGTQTFFDAQGRQTGSKDLVGREISFEYDGAGRLIKQTDPVGQEVTFGYQGNHLAYIQDPTNRRVALQHDGAGDLIVATYPDNTSRTFGYDALGLLTRETNTRGYSTQYAYNDWKRLESVTRPGNSTVTVNDSGSATAANNFIGGNVGELKEYGEGQDDAKDTITDPDGVEMKFIKDTRGYLMTLKNPDGGKSIIERDSEGRPLSVTKFDTNGSEISKSTYVYNQWGDVTRQSNSVTGITVETDYDAIGNVTRQKNGRGFESTSDFDPDTGLIVRSTNTLGQVTEYTYTQAPEPVGLVKTVRFVPLNQITTYEYDSLGNLSAVIDPAGNRTETTRNLAGFVIETKNAKNQRTVMDYDAMNLLKSVTQAVGTAAQDTTTYTYNAGGNLEKILDPNGNEISLAYDELNRLTARTDPHGAATQFEYSASNLLKKKIQPNGDEVLYDYDGSKRLERKQTFRKSGASLAMEQEFLLEYDDKGNLKSTKDADSRLELGYDGTDRLISARTFGLGELASIPDIELEFDYDNNGNRLAMREVWHSPSASEKTHSYTYDDGDRLTSITNPKGETFVFGFDNGGRLHTLDRTLSGSSTAIRSTFNFDTMDFVTGILHGYGAATLTTFNYTRDPLGNRTQMATPSGNHDYTYDDHNQVKTASNPDAPAADAPRHPASLNFQSYGYDPIGNRTADQGGSFSYKKNTALKNTDRLIEDYRYLYAYDLNGNLVTRTSKISFPVGETTNYTYSVDNQLTQMELFASGATEPFLEARYFYDPTGKRIARQVIDHRAENDPRKTFERRYVYDGQEILLEFDGDNQFLTRYTHSGLGTDDVMAAEVTAAGVAAEVAPQTGSYAFLKDSLGTVMTITDSTGHIRENYVYSVYGERLAARDAVGSNQVNSAFSFPYAFAGRELDTESGLYYVRARYYDSQIGRFLQRDPDPGKLEVPRTATNGYSYAANNPGNITDPSGASFFDTFIGKLVFGIIVGALSALTGGLAGGAIASLTGTSGTLLGGIIGAATGAIVGGLTGGIVGGTLYRLDGKSWAQGFQAGGMIGMIAGAVAGFMKGNSVAQGKEAAQKASQENSEGVTSANSTNDISSNAGSMDDWYKNFDKQLDTIDPRNLVASEATLCASGAARAVLVAAAFTAAAVMLYRYREAILNATVKKFMPDSSACSPAWAAGQAKLDKNKKNRTEDESKGLFAFRRWIEFLYGVTDRAPRTEAKIPS